VWFGSLEVSRARRDAAVAGRVARAQLKRAIVCGSLRVRGTLQGAGFEDVQACDQTLRVCHAGGGDAAKHQAEG
jgi:hypothetical protein